MVTNACKNFHVHSLVLKLLPLPRLVNSGLAHHFVSVTELLRKTMFPYRLSLVTLTSANVCSQPFSDPSVRQIPLKSPTKEPTEPIDHVLHSEVHVVRCVKFDSQVSSPLLCLLVHVLITGIGVD